MSKRAGQTKRVKPPKVRDIFVPRPFAGLVDEAQWVAIRELVPAATAALTLQPELRERYGDREVTLATVLPMAWPAMIWPDGTTFVGAQRNTSSGDASRDLAASLLAALQTQPGEPVDVPALPGVGPRLQDVLEDGRLEVTLHEDFSFWLDPEAAGQPTAMASLEQANAAIYPTVKLAAAHAAYWCRVREKSHVRWVLPDDEDPALDALARLSASDSLLLGEGTKFAGMFRAYGLLVPVWDVPREPAAQEWEAALADVAKRYAEALAVTDPLTQPERRSRQGLLGRQLTLR